MWCGAATSRGASCAGTGVPVTRTMIPRQNTSPLHSVLPVLPLSLVLGGDLNMRKTASRSTFLQASSGVSSMSSGLPASAMAETV